MRAFKSGLVLATLMTMSSIALATPGTSTGRVSTFLTSDSTAVGQLVTLEAVTSAGICFRAPVVGGLVYFRLPDTTKGDQMRAIVVSALMAGRTIQIAWDDSSRDGTGRCFVKQVSITN